MIGLHRLQIMPARRGRREEDVSENEAREGEERKGEPREGWQSKGGMGGRWVGISRWGEQVSSGGKSKLKSLR